MTTPLTDEELAGITERHKKREGQLTSLGCIQSAPDRAHIDRGTLLASHASLLQLLDAANKKLEALPKTADGVTITPGMMVWVMPPICANPGGFGWSVDTITRTMVDTCKASEVYSTLVAARASLRNGTKTGQTGHETLSEKVPTISDKSGGGK